MQKVCLCHAEHDQSIFVLRNLTWCDPCQLFASKFGPIILLLPLALEKSLSYHAGPSLPRPHRPSIGRPAIQQIGAGAVVDRRKKSLVTNCWNSTYLPRGQCFALLPWRIRVKRGLRICTPRAMPRRSGALKRTPRHFGHRPRWEYQKGEDSEIIWNMPRKWPTLENWPSKTVAPPAKSRMILQQMENDKPC